MGRVADNGRWALVSGVFRAFGTLARLTGDPVGGALSGSEFLRDPYPFYDDVRSRGRVARGRMIWPTADYRLCREILRDNRFIKAEDGGPDAPFLARMAGARSDPAIAHPLQPPSMLALDPPEHTRFRSLVSKAFTPRAIEQLRPRIQEVTSELLDAAATGGTLDVVHDFAGPLPVTVISEILGIPAGDRAEFRSLGSDMAKMIDLDLSRRDYLDAMSALRKLNAFFDGHIDRVRRDPGDDILSQLVHVEIDGDRLSNHELKATAILLLVAGFETTVNLIGNGTMLLLGNPDQLKLLRADETLWPNAVEEMLRIDPPVQYTGRVATQNVEIDGVAFPRKRMVAVLIGGANNDPEMFPDPRRFDVARDNARDQLAFSAGIHYCIGASLARLEGEIALQTLFTRYPDLEQVGQPVRRRTRLLRGYDSIPVQLVHRLQPTPTKVS
jgi:cytochrome P450